VALPAYREFAQCGIIVMSRGALPTRMSANRTPQ
jgi:hypothetical protein